MALSLTEIIAVFGDPFGGKLPVIKPDGSITVDLAWWHANITVIRLPYSIGRVFECPCHVLIAPHLRAVFEDLARNGLTYLVETIDGCEVARIVRGSDPPVPSDHTFGIAIDINASKFPRGSTKVQDARLVAAFAAHGFRCGQIGGGLWQHPAAWDPMHFEFADLSLIGNPEQGGAAPKDQPPPESTEPDLPAIDIVVPGIARPLAGTIEDGHLWGPVREIAESLGGVVTWDSALKSCLITKS